MYLDELFDALYHTDLGDIIDINYIDSKTKKPLKKVAMEIGDDYYDWLEQVFDECGKDIPCSLSDTNTKFTIDIEIDLDDVKDAAEENNCDPYEED